MSKSDLDEKSRIELSDPPDVVRSKLKKALTDMTGKVSYEPESRRAVSNLIELHSAVTGKSPDVICQEAELLQTAQYKLLIADDIVNKFQPIRQEYLRLKNDKRAVESMLEDGAQKAKLVAVRHMLEIKRIFGFY